MSDVISLRLSSQKEQTKFTQYRFLELPVDLCKLIESNPSEVRLEIKGREGDDAVLCTESKTYALRSVNVSNSLHVATGSRELETGDDLFLSEVMHEIMELVPTVPKLDRLKGALRGSEYGEEEWDNEIRDDPVDQEQRRYSRAEMAQVVQASDVEFSKALRDQHILELEGYLRPLPVEPLSNILVYIFTSLISYGLPMKEIPASRLTEILQVEHEVPSAVTAQVMHWFGSVSGDRWEMNEVESVRQVGLGLLRPHTHEPVKQDLLVSQWRNAVGDVFSHHVKLSLLRGEYLTQGNEGLQDVIYFSRSRLPTEPLQRFNELFLTRSKWKESDMVSFLEDIAVDKKDCDRLLIKYARRSAERDGTPNWALSSLLTQPPPQMPISRDTLNAIRSAISDDVKRHASIKVVLEKLSQFESDDPKQIRQAWENTSHDLARLVRDGVILDRKLVDTLANEVVSLTSIPKSELQDFKQTAERFLELGGGDNKVAEMVLPGVPHDLQEGAAAAFTLRAMAIHPTRALPPGKSLVSLFMNHSEKVVGEEQRKAKEVADLLKRAFWDSALEQISSSSPEIQLPRIKLFYQDLFDALRPFISPSHPVMVALRSPLPPSPNPLVSALNYLESSFALMRTVCAPVRDQAIDEAIKSIDSLDKLHASTEELAKAYIFGIKLALDMSNTLVEDYQGAMSKFGDNSRIAAMFRGSAREHERDTFLAAFGEEELKRSWKEWQQSSFTSPSHWTDKLVDVVSTLDPVMSSQEILPPILRMNRLDIAESQSRFLGVLVAASLRTLVPPLPVGRQTLLYRNDQVALKVEAQFMERLWAIIGADPYTTDPTQQASIENMASEVIRLYRQRNTGLPTIAAKEKELNNMVARMVDDEAHPVRVLLKKRVTDALKERLSHPIVPLEHDVPITVTTGRSMKPVVRLKPGKVFAAEQMEADLVIPGFSDPLLKSQLRQILHMLRIVQGWVEYTWNDIYTI